MASTGEKMNLHEILSAFGITTSHFNETCESLLEIVGGEDPLIASLMLEAACLMIRKCLSRAGESDLVQELEHLDRDTRSLQ